MSSTSRMSHWLLICLALGIILVLVSPINRIRADDASNDNELAETIRSVCDGTLAKPLTSITRVRSLIDYIQRGRGEKIVACEQYERAFLELDAILEIVQTGKICNLQLVGLIRDYHNEFIRQDKGASKRVDGFIPKALRYFFMALSFQIDAECKMTFILNLEQDSKKHITEEDYYSVSVLEKMGATLLDDESIGDYDDIVLMNDLKSVEEGLQINLMIKTRTSQLMLELMRNCRNKFRPIYEKLIFPLIELSNLGYDYQGELLARELDELKSNKLVVRWYNIVQICETFSAFIIYEDPEVKLHGNSQMVTFINAEEAQDLEARQIKSVAEQLEAATDNETTQMIHYEPEASLNHDELWVVNQAELDKLISKLKASATEENRIKRRLMKKLFNKIIKTISSGQVFVFSGELLASKFGRKEKGAPVREINEELIKLFDEAVAKVEQIDQNTPAVSSRLGNRVDRNTSSPKHLGYNGKIPPRADIRETVNGSKMSVKFYDGILSKFLISKADLFFTILLIIGFGLIVVGMVMTLGSG